MAGELALDTNAAIAVIKRDAAALALVSRPQLFIPAVVIGELFYGAYRSTRQAENIRNVTDLADSFEVLNRDSVTTLIYGRVKADLISRGRRIPDNDLWIAASWLRHALPIMSKDAHFDEVSGLQRISW